MDLHADLTALTLRVDGLESAIDARMGALAGRVALLERAEQPTSASAEPPPPVAAPPPPPPVSRQERADATVRTESVPTGPPPAAPPPPPTTAPIPQPAAARSGPSFEVGVEAILRWAGVSLVVLSAVFLVSTAISRGWIGPNLQLLGAVLIGFAMLGAALRLVEESRTYALALANGGAAVLILCAGAAHIWLDLYSALTGLIMVAIAAVIALVVAAELRMESVAVTATAAMLLVPTWAEIIADAPVMATGIWLGAFAVVATIIGLNRGWVLYRAVSTWSAALWVLGLAGVLFSEDNTDHVIAGIALVAVVGIVLWLNPVLADRRGRTVAAPTGSTSAAFARGLSGFEHRTALLVPLWTWGSILLFGGWSADDPGGVIGLGLAAGFAAVALIVGPLLRWISNVSFGSHLLGASLLVTVAVVAWLGGPTLMVVLGLQALATLILAGLFTDGWLKVNAYALASIAALLLLAGVAETIDLGRTVTGDNVAHGVVVASLAGVALLSARREQPLFSHVVNGAVWLTGLAYIASLLFPFIDARDWLVVGVVLGVAGILAKRLGPLVLALGLAVSGATILGAALSIVDAAANGTDVLGHLANFSVVAAMVGGTWVLWANGREMDIARILFVASSIAVLGWVASVLVAAPQGQVAVSAAWAIIACSAIVAGVRSDESVVRGVGLATLALVLAKLLTVDLAEVDTLWRVGLFMVIGLGLLRLGYLLPSMAERFGREDAAVSANGSNP